MYTSSVTFEHSLNFSEAQFLHLQNGDNTITSEVIEGVDEKLSIELTM